ncbi:hypothetical protein I3843_02G154800 [Carya illinoinensis]|nr:hypothetical protein I3760_02G176700 [Carya illinoinensis]KAG7992981.1 hypothetical protein I3843_02G154800 [Carya illinoinensis]
MRLINWKSLPGRLGKQASRRQLPVPSLLYFLGPCEHRNWMDDSLSLGSLRDHFKEEQRSRSRSSTVTQLGGISNLLHVLGIQQHHTYYDDSQRVLSDESTSMTLILSTTIHSLLTVTLACLNDPSFSPLCNSTTSLVKWVLTTDLYIYIYIRIDIIFDSTNCF